MADELPPRFAAHIAQLEKRIRDLEKGSRSPQLGNASLDLATGRGYIPIKNNGKEMGRLGRQPDGTINFTSMGNNIPPAIPILPQCEPGLAIVEVTCYGLPGEQPKDFSHVKVYVDGLHYGNISTLPGKLIVGPLSYTNHSFYLTSVNLSGAESAPTAFVFAQPRRAVGTDITDGIIDALKIADLAITEAKVAVGAITAPKLIDGAVTTPKIAAAAVVAEAIAANAIIAGKIAAGTVTAVEIAALTILAGNIAADAIAAGKIAAEVISAREIQALAVTADKLAANSVTAGAILAGTITADKLAVELILASKVIIGNQNDWHLELDGISGTTPIMWWNNSETGFALTRDAETGLSNAYLSGRMQFGTGSQLDSDIIDLMELPSTGFQVAKTRQARTWIQSALSPDIRPKWPSPTMKSSLLIMSVYQIGSGSTPNCGTPSGSQLIHSQINGQTRLSVFIVENAPASRTSEYFASTTGNARWGITLTELQGMQNASFDVNAFNSGTGTTASTGTTINSTYTQELQVAIYGAASGQGSAGSMNNPTNAFNKALLSGSDFGFGVGVFTKTVTTTGTASTAVTIPNASWIGQILTFRIAPAATVPPAPPANTVRFYTQSRASRSTPHIIESDGSVYPIGRSPFCTVRCTANFSMAAQTDIYAQGGWAAPTGGDPDGMAAISTGAGSFSSITLPISGRWFINYKTIFDPSTDAIVNAACFITANDRVAGNSVARDSRRLLRYGTGDLSPVQAFRPVQLNAGTVLYWGNWSQIAIGVNAVVANIFTEITVDYMGPL